MLFVILLIETGRPVVCSGMEDPQNMLCFGSVCPALPVAPGMSCRLLAGQLPVTHPEPLLEITVAVYKGSTVGQSGQMIPARNSVQ